MLLSKETKDMFMINSDVENTFRAVIVQLNEIKIVPMVYGSLSLNMQNICKSKINDVDLIIDKSDLENRWQDICNAMAKVGYKIDPDHSQEFIGIEPFVSFDTYESVAEFADVDFENKKLCEDGALRYYMPVPEQLLKIYQAGLKDKFRQNRKGGKDIETIKAIEEFIRNNTEL